MTDAGTTVAVLGTGVMGLPMAANLAGAGFTVRAWNRTRDKALPLTEHGVTVAETVEEAVEGAELVLTMLQDGPSAQSVAERMLPALGPGTVWVQTSTVGLEWTGTLAGLAADAGIAFVDAPVLGTKQPAEQGKLIVLASGPEDLRDTCAPVFDAVGARTMWLGEAGAGSRLKLVVNAWIVALTNATAESVALAGKLGVDPDLFFQAIDGGPLDVAYAHVKGGQMVDDEFPVSFAARHAAKDAGLVLEAGGGLDLAGTRAALTHLHAAVEAGYGDEDMAVLIRAVTGSSS